MSRPTVVRRLTAVIALLAIFCLALPAVAAPGAHGPSHRTRAVHASSLVDQLVAWIGSVWTGPAQGQTAPAEKGIQISPSGANGLLPLTNEADHGGMIDPNG
jgi:hypothetical protein